jgi:hypothetical protein
MVPGDATCELGGPPLQFLMADTGQISMTVKSWDHDQTSIEAGNTHDLDTQAFR